jgi:hypothetical protein
MVCRGDGPHLALLSVFDRDNFVMRYFHQMHDVLRVLLCVLVLGCGDSPEVCGLESTLPEYAPLCDTAGLTFYPDESRVAVGGSGGYLVLSLPPELVVGEVYGGTSGRPLLALLTLGDGSEELANARTSTVRVGSLSESTVALGLWLYFDSGEVTGAFQVPVLPP